MSMGFRFFFFSMFLTGLSSLAIASNQQWSYVLVDGGIEVTGMKNSCPIELTIPQTIDDRAVVKIGAGAFKERSLKHVSLPPTVIEIGANAFKSNNLSEIKLPDSVIILGADAFSNNQLSQVTLSKNLKTIGDGAFWTNNFRSVLIPNSVTTIGDYAFGQTGLESVVLPDSVVTLGTGAFAFNRITFAELSDGLERLEDSVLSHNSIKAIDIPKNVTSLGRYPFNFSELEYIHFKGARPLFTENSLPISEDLQITYCDGQAGWPGDPISGLTPVEGCKSALIAANQAIKADIAFVLRGYGDSTLYPTLESFVPEADSALEAISSLSFGTVSSYEILDGGIDTEGADYYASVAAIETVEAALAGWPGQWQYFLDRDGASGDILVDPTPEEISVLEAFKQWLIDNRQPPRNWRATELGAVHYDAWVGNKVIRYGGSAAVGLLEGLQLPQALDLQSYHATGIIFSSDGQYNTSAAQNGCAGLGIKLSNGDSPPPATSCFYNDYSMSSGFSIEQSMKSSTSTTTHEAIHALGHGGHDRDTVESYFPYSVMNQGAIDQYPIWNRIFIFDWLTEANITTDRDQLEDYSQAQSAEGKYLLRLGSENDFSCDGGWTLVGRCKRYQELFDGTLVQYRGKIERGDETYFKVGVGFEPILDVNDRTYPSVVSGRIEQDVEGNSDRDLITVTFDENIALGSGEVRLIALATAGGASPVTLTLLLNRLPELTDERVWVSGNQLKLRSPHSGRSQYAVDFKPGAVTDWGGNSIIGRHCAYLQPSTEVEQTDLDGDGIVDCADAFPADDSETLDTDWDGIGNVADADDDGDGVDDVVDPLPLDASESRDTDGDGVGNRRDTDDDGDSVDDWRDAFPLDATEHLDTDGDGIGNQSDNDDDNDGVLDVDDDLPLDPTESVDSNGNGVGDTKDRDDDCDGANDDEDAFPLDASETADSDNDGVGDNSDAFPFDVTESVDSDSDGVGDNGDNCSSLTNEDQLNTDEDAEGDACDADDDNDGFSDKAELADGTDPLSRFSCKTGCFSFDVDESLQAQPLTDGLLVIRHLFGFSGDSLISGAVSGEAGRDSSEAIAGYLTDADSQLDIDGDGESKPLTDGLLLIRYLFGFSGDSLISGAIGDGAERDTAEEVEAYIKERVPLR